MINTVHPDILLLPQSLQDKINTLIFLCGNNYAVEQVVSYRDLRFFYYFKDIVNICIYLSDIKYLSVTPSDSPIRNLFTVKALHGDFYPKFKQLYQYSDENFATMSLKIEEMYNAALMQKVLQ